MAGLESLLGGIFAISVVCMEVLWTVTVALATKIVRLHMVVVVIWRWCKWCCIGSW